jgi:hypothetical protein
MKSNNKAPLHRLELCSPAPEADALSTELQGRATGFYHITFRAERRECACQFRRRSARKEIFRTLLEIAPYRVRNDATYTYALACGPS